MYAKITEAPQGIKQNRWLDISVTNKEHHAMKCISSSHLKFLLGGASPSTYFKKYISKDFPRKTTKAFAVGTLAHLAVSLPEIFNKQVLECNLDQRTNEFKEFQMSLVRSAPKIFEELPLEKQQEIMALRELEKLKEIDYKKSFNSLKEQENLNLEILKTESISEEKDKALAKKSLKEREKSLKSLDKNYKDNLKKSVVIEENPEIIFTEYGGFLDKNGEEKFIVKSEEMKMYRTFQQKCESHKRLSLWFSEGIVEQSGVAQDPITGLWLSCRPDFRIPRGFFLDPKTIEGLLTKKNIQNYIQEYSLHIQAAHYIDTANEIEPNTYKAFFFVFLSKEAPYEIALVKLNDESIEKGRIERRRLLNQLAEHESKNDWPEFDYNGGQYALTMGLPPWSFKE